MLDRNYLREHNAEAMERLAARGLQFVELLSRFEALDARRRDTQGQLDGYKAERNELSRKVGELMKAGQRAEGETLKEQARRLGEDIALLEADFRHLEAEELDVLHGLPNLPHESVPTGGEEQAVLLSEQGTPRGFDFTPKDHVELGRHLGLFNLEAGVRVTGAGFPFMVGQGALLQRALINFMLDLHTREHGYTELRPPFIVHPRSAMGTGQLPKFGEQMYQIRIEGEEPWPDCIPMADNFTPHFFLIPTAEVPVANYYRDMILEQPALPLKFCAYSPCFRVEAGSYGKDVRGLTRLHQFEKVELVRLAHPDQSWDDLEEITREAEAVLERLNLPYRRKLLPTGDMAFGSAKTYDLELFSPAAGWLEVSSASNTTDYQARRANVRIRTEAGGKPQFAHLLNASGLALPRLIIALLETYQRSDGSVEVPEVLRAYLGGMTELTPQAGAPPLV